MFLGVFQLINGVRMSRLFLLVILSTSISFLGAYSINDAKKDLRKNHLEFQTKFNNTFASHDRNMIAQAMIQIIQEEFDRPGSSELANIRIMNDYGDYSTEYSDLRKNMSTLIWHYPKAQDIIGEFCIDAIERLKFDHVHAILIEMPSWIKRITQAALDKLELLDAAILQEIEKYDASAKSKFAKKRKALLKNRSPRKFFKDIAGDIPQDILEIVEFLYNPEKFERFGVSMPRGILLEGPPGTGKTSIAKAIAQSIGAAFFNANGSEFVDKWVGQGPANIRKLFQKATNAISSNEYDFAIVFIDEIDAVATQRSGLSDGGNKEFDNTVNELLAQMDGLNTPTGLLVIAATNNASCLDDALLRPGRFDRIVKIGLPIEKSRVAIIEYYLEKMASVSNQIDINTLAQRTGGFNGADLKQMVTEAAINAIRANDAMLEQKHLLAACDKIMRSVKQRKKWNGAFGNYSYESMDNKSNRDAFKALAGTLPDDVLEIIDFINNTDRFKKMGAQMPKGALLEGPPGTGKTTIARCIAQSAGAAFFNVNGSEFVNKYVGQGPANVRRLFDAARTAVESGGCKKAIIFIDELDAVGRQRGSDGCSERDNTLNELLAQMDGFAANSSIFIIAATNNACLLDTALKRPGRFDRIIKIGLPDETSRLAILMHYAKQLPTCARLVFDTLAKATKGVSGAVLKNLVNEAAVFAARDKDAQCVEQIHFELALKKIIEEGYIPHDYSKPLQLKESQTQNDDSELVSDDLSENDDQEEPSKGWFW
jgi:ATP-dependent Zn protease